MTTKSRIKSKYNSRGVWFDKRSGQILSNPSKSDKKYGIHFDSTFEFEVFNELRKLESNLVRLCVHPRLPIADFKVVLQNYKNVNFWKPDFLITRRDTNNKIIFQAVIEVKGMILQPFPYQYALFCQKYPKIPVFLIAEKQDIAVVIQELREVLLKKV